MTLTDAPPEPEHLARERAEADAHAPRTGSPAQRTPPHNLDAEAAVLGACLLNRDAIEAVLDEGLDDRDLYAPRHGHIWAAIVDLYAGGHPVDPVTVAAHLKANGTDIDAGTLLDLGTSTPASSNAAAYARTVIDAARARRLIATGTDIAALGWDHHADIDAAETTARDLVTRVTDRPTERHVAYEDVAAAMRGEVDAIEPTILTRTDGQALIYPGLLHWLMGDPGKGKTWVQILAAAEVIQRGGKVLLLDWEGNRRIIGDRFAALGLTPDQITQGLRYWRPTRLDRHIMADLTATVVEDQVELVCYDGVAKALARNDHDEDRAPDVLAWLELAVHPLTEAGASALVLDHLKKDKEGAGLWPRGSGAKQGEVSGAAWKVVPRVAFSRRKPGHFDLIQAKDREGFVGEDGSVVAQCHATPTAVGLDLVLRPPPGGEFEPTMYMEKVSRFLEELGDGASQNDIEKGVGGKAEYVREAIAAMVRHGHIDRQKVGRGRHHVLVRAYREDEPNAHGDDSEEF